MVLPSDETTLESLEGMLVSVRQPVVTENYNAGLYGEITVAAERQFQYTQASQTVSDVVSRAYTMCCKALWMHHVPCSSAMHHVPHGFYSYIWSSSSVVV